jgi:hypothetical protein
VHEIQVEVVGTKLLKGVLQGQLDVFGVVVVFEEFGSDEELFSGYTSSLDTFSNFTLVLVSPGATAADQRGSRVRSQTYSMCL